MDRSFKMDVKLDKYNLDVCAMEQAEKYADWAEKWADAVDVRDRMKDTLTLAKAEADEEIRIDPGAFGWSNTKAVTEAWITTAVIRHPKVKECNENFLVANHAVNVLSVAKESFEQRRKMLEVLSNLYMSSYFSGNKDFDKTYRPAVEAEMKKAQEAQLETNPRIARRKLNGTA